MATIRSLVKPLLENFNPNYYRVKLKFLESILEELRKEAPLSIFELQKRTEIKTLKTLLDYLKELEEAGIIKEIEEEYYTLLVEAEPTQFFEKEKWEYTEKDWAEFIEHYKDFFNDFLETNVEGIFVFLNEPTGRQSEVLLKNFINTLVDFREEWMEKVADIRRAYEDNMKKREFLLNYLRDNKTKEYLVNKFSTIDEDTQRSWEEFIKPKIKEKYEEILKYQVLRPFNLRQFENNLFLEFLGLASVDFLKVVISKGERSGIVLSGDKKEKVLTQLKKCGLITDNHLYNLMKNDYEVFVFDEVERSVFRFVPSTGGVIEVKEKVKALNPKETYRKILISLIEKDSGDEFVKNKMVEFCRGQLDNTFKQSKIELILT